MVEPYSMNTFSFLLTLGLAALSVSAVPAMAQEAATSGFDPKGLWDGRKLVPFRALDDPKMVTAKEADFLTDDDYVLALTVAGESRAYPTRFVWFHHAINDKVGKPGAEQHFAVTYCSVCNTGMRFDTNGVDKLGKNKPVLIDFYGLYNGVACYAERGTESVFLQLSGEFVTGPLAGAQLPTGPLLDTTWKEWRTRHPDTLVMSPDTPFKQFYSPKDKPEPRGYTQFPRAYFGQSMTRTDKRLPRFEKVLAVAVPAAKNAAPLTRAYPITALQDAGSVINDMLGDKPLAVFLDTKTTTANALYSTLDGRKLTFELRSGDGKTGYFDRETSSRWNIEGVAEEGKLKGKALQPASSHLSQWYGWVAYFPQTTIYGRTDAPQTEAWME